MAYSSLISPLPNRFPIGGTQSADDACWWGGARGSRRAAQLSHLLLIAVLDEIFLDFVVPALDLSLAESVLDIALVVDGLAELAHRVLAERSFGKLLEHCFQQGCHSSPLMLVRQVASSQPFDGL